METIRCSDCGAEHDMDSELDCWDGWVCTCGGIYRVIKEGDQED